MDPHFYDQKTYQILENLDLDTAHNFNNTTVFAEIFCVMVIFTQF